MPTSLEAAAAAARAALAAGRASADDHAALGWEALRRGDDGAAHDALQQALQLAPRQVEALVGMANLLRRQGRLRDAVLHCDAALAANPRSPDAWLERAFVLSAGGSMAAASDCYHQVLSIDPDHPAAHAGLASIHARDGRAALARSHAHAALKQDPGNAIAGSALAATALEAGNLAEAQTLLQPLVAGLNQPSAERSLLANQLGDCEARLGHAEAAFSAYQLSKADFAALHHRRFAGPCPAREFAERITHELHRTTPEQPPPADGIRPGLLHLFLIGFPRSGTTLAENILASIPGLAALEEMPTLRVADQAFLAQPGGLARFSACTADDRSTYRAAYWEAVERALGRLPERGFVDMDPLKGTRLPLIAGLFPDAKVVVVRRDPRDVVWSCFHTHFALTNAAMDFTTLEGAARFYDAMMTLIEDSRHRLNLSIHDLRYEQLVQDFDQATQSLCAYAGLPWSEELRRFDQTARRRGVATASAGQVRKGLFDGSGQWRPFARQLEPVMPILAPWIERFGYAD